MDLKNAYDALIVGSGVAGLYGALQFPPDKNVLILSKYEKTTSSSNLAQGGVAAVLSFEDDSFELHREDTFIAGRRANDPAAVDVLVREGPDDVRRVMELGVRFDRNADGELDKTLEGGHSRRRIVHWQDRTGAELVRGLLAQAEARENLDYAENTALVRLTKAENGFRADLLRDGAPVTVYCSYCMLCTGGIGRVYRYTTNPKSATGDGIRFAWELGAEIRDLHYIQFHPTAFDSDDGEQFLISESVRGEGAYLLNGRKERFMDRYDPRLELAPRDVVSHSIIEESRRLGDRHFYLDIRHEDADFLRRRFPEINRGCLAHGVDFTKDLIPVFPCHHYLMGGVRVDTDSRTTVDRLYACGECSNTGVHGKNRLASNSLLEALVYSRRAAADILRRMDSGEAAVIPGETGFDPAGAPLPEGIPDKIRALMQKAYFVIPDEKEIPAALAEVTEIRRELSEGGYALTAAYTEALSLATVAQIVLTQASAG